MNATSEDMLMEFLRDRTDPFSLHEVLSLLGEYPSPQALADLADYLILNHLRYVLPGSGDDEDLWLSRAGVFTGQCLVIEPTKMETGAGILVPGSRFLPFYNPVLLPSELRFFYKGKELERTILDCTPEEMYGYYWLFGEEFVPQYLSLDSEENERLYAEADFEDPESVAIWAIDMEGIYWEADFAATGRVLARVTDWDDGCFELVPLSPDQNDPRLRGEWLEVFESSLMHSFEIAGPSASIEEQLAFAFFLGRDSLFAPHAATVDEFISWTRKIGIEPYGVETRLWRVGDEIPPFESWGMSVVTAPRSALEMAFLHLGLPLSEEVFDSYVLDALFRKESNPIALLSRMLPPFLKGGAMCSPAIEKAAERRMADFARDYNWFADNEVGPLRSRYLTLHAALSRFMLLMERAKVRPSEIPDQGAVVLGQLLSHTVSALETIDFDEERNEADIVSLYASIEGMEDSFFETKTAIQNLLPTLGRDGFSVIQREDEPDA